MFCCAVLEQIGKLSLQFYIRVLFYVIELSIKVVKCGIQEQFQM